MQVPAITHRQTAQGLGTYRFRMRIHKARRAPQSMAKQAVQTPQDIHRFRLCIQAKFAKWLTSGRKSVSIAPELQRSRTGRNQSIGEQQGLGQVEWRCRARRDGR